LLQTVRGANALHASDFAPALASDKRVANTIGEN
jgi:hypothetical protein